MTPVRPWTTRWRRHLPLAQPTAQAAAVDRLDRHFAGNQQLTLRQWVASIASSPTTDSPRARQWSASITTSLVVLAAALWLYRSEVANPVEIVMPAVTWQALQE